MARMLTNLGSPVVVVVIVLLLQQHIQLAQGALCSTNPCNHIAGIYDLSTGYCCIDIPSSNNDNVCTCPNGIASRLNAPCRSITTNPTQTACTRTCANGGVCNIVNGQQVCWCTLGFAGTHCEIQGIQTTCFTGLCQTGNCFQQTIGVSTYAYCRCLPGYTGTTCNQCYFTCPSQGAFPDTAYCSTGRYFICSQAGGAPASALCTNGQQFNPTTRLCDAAYKC